MSDRLKSLSPVGTRRASQEQCVNVHRVALTGRRVLADLMKLAYVEPMDPHEADTLVQAVETAAAELRRLLTLGAT